MRRNEAVLSRFYVRFLVGPYVTVIQRGIIHEIKPPTLAPKPGHRSLKRISHISYYLILDETPPNLIDSILFIMFLLIFYTYV